MKKVIKNWDKILTGLIALAALGVSILSFRDSKNKNNIDEAISHTVITYTQEQTNLKKVSVKYGQDAKGKKIIKKYPMAPVRVNIKSGAIAQIYSILSVFNSNDKPIVLVSADTLPHIKMRSMNKDKVEVIPKEVSSFWNDGFYQSFLIVGTDGTNHLIMVWYNTKELRQGFIDNIRSVSTTDDENGNNPDYIVQQYNQLKNYLNQKGIEIK